MADQRRPPRRISFLARTKKVERDGCEAGPDLDEEMEKVFESGEKDRFDLATISSAPTAQPLPRYCEKDYSFHRKKSYPHMHMPLKALHSRAMRKRSAGAVLVKDSQETTTSVAEETINENEPEPEPEPESIKISQVGTDSDTGQSGLNTNTSLPISSPDFDEGSTLEDLPLSESEAPQLSERAAAYDASLYNTSPERKVQFDIGSPTDLSETKEIRITVPEQDPQDSQDDSKKEADKKRRRHSRHHHHRKHSVPEDPGWRKRSGAQAIPRQMSSAILEETATLQEADQDELVSHRFDISKGKRRFSVKNKDPSRKESTPIIIPGQKKLFDHSPHEVFVQLDELSGFGDEREWKETARWIKYEEDVEEGAERWGRPHVAPLSFHSLLNLRKCLETGVILLDLEEKELPGVVYRVVEQMVVDELITSEDKPTVMRALLLRHRHVQEHDRFRFNMRRNTSSYTSLQNLNDEHRKARIGIVPSATSLDISKTGNLLQPPNIFNHTAVDMKEETYMSSSEDLAKKATKESILKRIPIGAEATTVLVGAVDFLAQPTIAFIRLAEGILIPSVTEVPIPVRFMFILLGPVEADLDYHEIGRSISTLMSNPEFHKIAYKASARKELLSAINEFLDCSIVLPPGDWERQALLPIRELKAKTEAIRRRHSKSQELDVSAQKALLAAGDDKKPPFPDPLKRTRYPWGGLINDIKRRYPYFRSDVTDGLNGQCIAASIFMYFAALSGAITFGGLMADKTNNLVGISETLIATAASGIVFAFLSGQPLVIIGATGPLLLFDESLYTFCQTNGIDYLTMRVYIGIWLAIIALVVSFFEGSVFVKLFTRFTEEIFASLISLLYIVESVMKIYAVYEKHPLMSLAEYCMEANDTNWNYNSNQSTPEYMEDYPSEDGGIIKREANESLLDINDTMPLQTTLLTIPPPIQPLNQPNTALFCTILALGTFFIAHYLRHFRNSKFLGRSARRMLGDFGVPIAIVMMVSLDYVVPGTYTEKLKVPEGLSPSNPDVRGWIIPPSGLLQPLPIWVMFASIVPALLVYILLFMETHISELIIAKKERKLKKGSGFHLDIVLICLLNVGCGLMGAPFMCAATVRSVTHVSAVTVMSRTHAPGEKPHIIEVKEQRVSSLLVSFLIGASVLMSPLLRLVPMAVLFGVFLYMGISSINGIQFFDRCRLFFMPVKHHPQAAYVRRVQTLKMHLYTTIQLLCLVVLWVVKSSQISLAFPFFLILMVPLRAQLCYLFATPELRALDSDEPDAVDEEQDPDFYEEALLPG